MLAPSGSTDSPARAALVRRAIAAAVLAVATLAAYHTNLPGTFVLDDFAAVVENASIRQLWPLGAWLAAPPEAGVGGRPFANFTFALNHAIGGREPWSYHAGNIALHFSAALVLFAVVRRTLLRPPLRGQHGATFQSEIALWADTVAKRPASARAQGNLGAALLRANRLPESMAASEAALRLRPR
ncbi:MAG: hypothetical protein HY736_21495, partial [Verrucomicrobia bacterium]|nr:hypothetical protein [Verrucomicrobiota bacterium]